MTVQLAVENRKLNSFEISFIIKMFLESFEMKQEYLAERANVSLRTLERAVSGNEKDRPSDAYLKRIAKALQLEEDAFTKTQAIKTPEEVEKEASDIEKNYSKIELTRSKNAKDIFNTISGGHMYWSEVIINENDKAEEIAAGLVDYLQDVGDMLDDVSETSKLEWRRSLQEILDELKTEGFVLYHAIGKRIVGGTMFGETVRTPFKVYYYIIRRDSGEVFQALYPNESTI